MRQLAETEELHCRTSALQQFSSLEDHIWWVSTGHGDKKHCAICRGKYEWRAPNKILVMQFGTKKDEEKVFRALAVPQGLCENLINALKLLANQQKYGDSPIQNIIIRMD